MGGSLSLTLTLRCPICEFQGNANVVVGTRQLTFVGLAADNDGDFVRDRTQHVHYDDTVTPTCPNGHRLTVSVSIVIGRRP
jgi:hypothetical protein